MAEWFIKLGDAIKGESQAEGQNGAIDLLSWSWGMNNPGSSATGGGGGTGLVNVMDLNFTKKSDSATPAILKHCTNGTPIPTVNLYGRKAGGKQQFTYYDITMNDVLISSVSVGGMDGADNETDSVSLNFAKVKVQYFAQKKDGTVEPKDQMTYDLKKRKNV